MVSGGRKWERGSDSQMGFCFLNCLCYDFKRHRGEVREAFQFRTSDFMELQLELQLLKVKTGMKEFVLLKERIKSCDASGTSTNEIGGKRFEMQLIQTTASKGELGTAIFERY